MATGGYVIIDLHGHDIANSGEKTTIPGIYSKVEGAAGRKPLMVKNFVKNGIEQIPFYAETFVAAGSSAYQLVVNPFGSQTVTITVGSDDIVLNRTF